MGYAKSISQRLCPSLQMKDGEQKITKAYEKVDILIMAKSNPFPINS